MLYRRLVKRFFIALICTALVLVLVNTALMLPVWVYLMSVPVAAFLTFLYWRSFTGTAVCPTCAGTGKIQVQHGREVENDVCYTCDGEGRIPMTRGVRY